MKRDLYIEVSARIVAELEKGAAPWVKTWSATPGMNVPMNIVTKRAYSGVNLILLWLTEGRGWKAPHFLTFNQAKKLGGHVRKGETGTTVYLVKRIDVKDRKSEETKSISMLRAFTVFNVEQCEGLPERITDPTPAKPRNNDERDPTIDEFLAATGASIVHGGDRAFYSPSIDRVTLPAFTAFKSAASYYATAFHELGHWTGVKGRCEREFGKRFGDRAYAAEELVAELCAAFICAEFSIDGELRHAGYIANWIELLKDDPRAFFTACSKAQAAADYLRRTALADDVGEEAAETPAPLALAA